MLDHLLTNMRRSTFTRYLVTCLAFSLALLALAPVRQSLFFIIR